VWRLNVGGAVEKRSPSRFRSLKGYHLSRIARSLSVQVTVDCFSTRFQRAFDGNLALLGA